MDSGETLCWTYVMMCTLLYFFAIMSTALIGRQEAFEGNELVRVHFGDVLRSMLTLFQVLVVPLSLSFSLPLSSRTIC